MNPPIQNSALGAAQNDARTLLVESGPFAGGDLLSGLPIDGALNAWRMVLAA